MKKHNFSAGPSILPEFTFQQCAKAVLELNDMGLSLLEISHRSPEFVNILNQTRNLLIELLEIPDTHEVLFIQGGASMQFCMIPYNLQKEGGSTCYLDTGTWASKAIKEAQIFGDTKIVASSKEDNYKHIPTDYTIPTDANYFHLTTNNTIYGTQLNEFPESPIPVVADMSSDILSRKIDVSKFALIYAGAQKNIGPSGITLVIVRKDLLGKTNRAIPSMLDYQNYIDKGSMFNTPPTFAIYAMLQTLTWLKNEGGLDAIAKRNSEKATILYKEVDRNALFSGIVKTSDRSVMNATFQLNDPTLEAKFLELCEDDMISGIKGHRSIGGFRASMYNAMTKSSVLALVDVMQQFESKYA